MLDSDTLRVRDVTGATALVPLPNRVVREFQALLDVMERRLDGAIEPVRHRLMKKLAEMDRSRVETAVGPDITEKWAHKFNPKTKRPRYPTGHTVYWDVAAHDATDE